MIGTDLWWCSKLCNAKKMDCNPAKCYNSDLRFHAPTPRSNQLGYLLTPNVVSVMGTDLLLGCWCFTATIISFDIAQSWCLYSAAPLGGPACQHHDLTSHPTQSYWSLPYPYNAERLAGKQRVSICQSLDWFKQCSNLWIRIVPSPQTRGRWSTHSVILSGTELWPCTCMITL